MHCARFVHEWGADLLALRLRQIIRIAFAT